ncbi:MAG: hypothetical protein M3Q97_00945 [Bacteroidota bacterium]|nr:hypothetical protein [Bacteroidota bacterium]
MVNYLYAALTERRVQVSNIAIPYVHGPVNNRMYPYGNVSFPHNYVNYLLKGRN